MRKMVISGHSRGLGEALAEAMLEAGFAVLGLSRSGNRRLAGKFPHSFEEFKIDLADSTALAQWLAGRPLQQWFEQAAQAVLVNNAGSVHPIAFSGNLDAARQQHSIALNVTAALLLSDAFCRDTTLVEDRRILHISSGAGRNAYAGWSVYCASKAALDHHARALAAEQHPRLRIASLAPGVIDTAMQAEIRATSSADFPLRPRFDALHRDGGLLKPTDCARQVQAFLLDQRFGDSVVADLREQA